MDNDAVLTKDNMRKRNWGGDPTCMFCNCIETSAHLFFQCPVSKVIWMIVARCFGIQTIPSNIEQCWAWCEKWLPVDKKFHAWGIGAICWGIWKCRNKAVFEKKLIKSPVEIICHICSLLMYWTGLYDEHEREQMKQGVETVLNVAKEILAKQTAQQVNQLLLQDHEVDGDEQDQN